jgi:hypothetical protein
MHSGRNKTTVQSDFRALPFIKCHLLSSGMDILWAANILKRTLFQFGKEPGELISTKI